MTICDPTPVTTLDLGTNFFVQQGDVGKSRAEVVRPRLQELNPYVAVESFAIDVSLRHMDREGLKKLVEPFRCVVLTDVTLSVALLLNDICR